MDFDENMKENFEEKNTFMMFHIISHMIKENFKHMASDVELHPGQVGILFFLKKHGELSQRELAEKMHITAPSMTVAIQKLEKGAYVERKVDAKDQRILRIHLMPKGEELLRTLKGITDEAEKVALRNMSIEEIIILKRLLVQMKDNLMEANKKAGISVCNIDSKEGKESE